MYVAGGKSVARSRFKFHLPPAHEDDRESAEGRVRGSVAEETSEQEVGGRHADAVDLDLVRVHGAEQRVQQQRKDEDEDRCFPAPPERSLLIRQLVSEHPHSAFRSSRRPAPGRRPPTWGDAPRAARADDPRRAPRTSARTGSGRIFGCDHDRLAVTNEAHLHALRVADQLCRSPDADDLSAWITATRSASC